MPELSRQNGYAEITITRNGETIAGTKKSGNDSGIGNSTSTVAVAVDIISNFYEFDHYEIILLVVGAITQLVFTDEMSQEVTERAPIKKKSA